MIHHRSPATPPKVVFFDLDGTITDYHATAHNILHSMVPLLQQTFPGVDAVDFVDAYWEHFQEMEGKNRRGEVTIEILNDRELRFREVLHKMALRIPDGVPLAKRLALAYDRGRREQATLFPDVEETLELVHRFGAKTGVITQGSSKGQRGQMENLFLLDSFDIIVITEEVGISKPQVALYQKALEMAGVQASEAIMAGDRVDWDLQPGKEAGMYTILFTENSLYHRPEFDDHPAVDAVVDTHKEMQLLLQEFYPSSARR